MITAILTSLVPIAIDRDNAMNQSAHQTKAKSFQFPTRTGFGKYMISTPRKESLYAIISEIGCECYDVAPWVPSLALELTDSQYCF